MKKLTQDKYLKVYRLQKEVKQMKKTVQEIEELGTHKDDLKFNFTKGYELKVEN